MKLLTALLSVLALCVACVPGEAWAKTDKAIAGDSGAVAIGAAMEKVDLESIPFETITGDTTSLADFRGKVVLIVNVASKCGNTPQYAALEDLYKKYADSGLVVIGFPANNFGGQEPGTNKEILNFCQSTYKVSFPMMAKVSVKGDDEHPLFVAMTQKSNLPGEITWNFSKFLIDRKGQLVARFAPKVQPESEDVVGAIEKLL